MTDETVFGVQKNQIDKLRYYLTHKDVLKAKGHEIEVETALEIDHKVSKFLALEKSLMMKFGLLGSKWRFKLDHTLRKNMIDQFQSREFLRDEIMMTYKQSIGLEYNNFDESSMRKLSLELALP